MQFSAHLQALLKLFLVNNIGPFVLGDILRIDDNIEKPLVAYSLEEDNLRIMGNYILKRLFQRFPNERAPFNFIANLLSLAREHIGTTQVAKIQLLFHLVKMDDDYVNIYTYMSAVIDDFALTQGPDITLIIAQMTRHKTIQQCWRQVFKDLNFKTVPVEFQPLPFVWYNCSLTALGFAGVNNIYLSLKYYNNIVLSTVPEKVASLAQKAYLITLIAHEAMHVYLRHELQSFDATTPDRTEKKASVYYQESGQMLELELELFGTRPDWYSAITKKGISLSDLEKFVSAIEQNAPLPKLEFGRHTFPLATPMARGIYFIQQEKAPIM